MEIAGQEFGVDAAQGTRRGDDLPIPRARRRAGAPANPKKAAPARRRLEGSREAEDPRLDAGIVLALVVGCEKGGEQRALRAGLRAEARRADQATGAGRRADGRRAAQGRPGRRRPAQPQDGSGLVSGDSDYGYDATNKRDPFRSFVLDEAERAHQARARSARAVRPVAAVGGGRGVGNGAPAGARRPTPPVAATWCKKAPRSERTTVR